MNKEQEKRIENIIYRKLRWPFWVVMIVWLVAFIVAICVDLFAGTKIQGHMKNIETKEYYELVLTISTMLMAAIIFFYSVMNSGRLGITNRMIISYRLGGCTIPIWFMITLGNLLVIRIMLDTEMICFVLVNCVCMFLVQLLIILLILMSTSFHFNIKLICKIEGQQLELMQDYYSEDQFLWIYMIHHMEGVTGEHGVFLEKSKLMRGLLNVPLGLGGPCWEKVAYKYYYSNLRSVFGQIRDGQELEKLYTILYEFAKEKMGCALLWKQCILINSAILNAALDSGIAGKGGFCAYYINECVNREMRNEQIVLFYLFHELMYRGNIDAIDGRVIKPLKVDGKLEVLAENMRDDCLFFWEIWSEQYGIPTDVSVVSFYNAMRTLESKSSKSYPLMYIKSLMDGRRGDVAYSKNTVEK